MSLLKMLCIQQYCSGFISSCDAELQLCIVFVGAVVALIRRSVSETDKQPSSMDLLCFVSVLPKGKKVNHQLFYSYDCNR